MSAQHTPGPWTIRPYNFDNVQGAHGIFPEGRRIPICHSIMGGDLEEADANTALIAAAPDLLRELQNCVNVLSLALPLFDDESTDDKDSREKVGSVLDAARAAIARATGGAA